MVKYYFTNKRGLYLALVDEYFDKLHREIFTSKPNGKIALADFSQAYLNLIVANPWWPKFIAREVLFSKGEMQSVLIEKIKSIFVKRLVDSI